MRKILMNNGKEFITKNGKVVSGKVFENKNYICSKKCLNLLRGYIHLKFRNFLGEKYKWKSYTMFFY